MFKSFAVAVLALSGSSVTAKTDVSDHWAVIIAGSNSYTNYRHQADACHAYQIVKAKGIPEDQIIMMSYDDAADSPSVSYRLLHLYTSNARMVSHSFPWSLFLQTNIFL